MLPGIVIGGLVFGFASFIGTLFYYRPIVAREKTLAQAANSDASRMREFMKGIVATVDAKVDAVRKTGETELNKAHAFIGEIVREYKNLKAGAAHKLDELIGLPAKELDPRPKVSE